MFETVEWQKCFNTFQQVGIPGSLWTASLLDAMEAIAGAGCRVIDDIIGESSHYIEISHGVIEVSMLQPCTALAQTWHQTQIVEPGAVSTQFTQRPTATGSFSGFCSLLLFDQRSSTILLH